jgi:hypothetical protein
MSKIPPPTSQPPGDADRALDCEFYLEPAGFDIVDLALAASWTENEIDVAFLGLMRRRLLTHSLGIGGRPATLLRLL